MSKVWEAGAKLGDYCIMIDGDEELESAGILSVQGAMASGQNCCSLHIVYLWDREDQMRTDKLYREFRRPSLFRLITPELSFKRGNGGGNFHCSSAPVQLLSGIVPIRARLLHYGYLHREDRVRKYHWYNSIDPNNGFEDSYRHMVIGDLFPADFGLSLGRAAEARGVAMRWTNFQSSR